MLPVYIVSWHADTLLLHTFPNAGHERVPIYSQHVIIPCVGRMAQRRCDPPHMAIGVLCAQVQPWLNVRVTA